MDILSVVLVILSVIFLGVLVGLHTMISTSQKTPIQKAKEGFESGNSSVANQVRAVLDPMVSGTEDLCSVYTTIRKNAAKNEKAGQNISDAEVTKRVEKNLALSIPGGALSCPLLQYPREGSTDEQWLDFLQKLPSDFGARIVLMAIYARDFLKKTETDMKDALSGKVAISSTEGFASICPPDIAATRRLEKQKQLEAGCVLPEDAGPEQIKEQITKRLETLVAEKTKVLKGKDIDPLINIKPIIEEAKKSQAYLEKTANQAESGNLPIEPTLA